MSRRHALALSAFLAAAALGCADDEHNTHPADTSLGDLDDRPESHYYGTLPSRAAIITRLSFTRESPKGVAPGFDLDGKVSDASDATTCNTPDFVHPDGTPGIDNQLAEVLPGVEAVVGNAVDGLVQGGINDGQLLILLEMDNVPDPRNAPAAKLTFEMGTFTRPTLGTDGVIEGFQTFDIDPERPVSHTDAKLADGEMTAGPFELAIPIAIFDVSFILHVHGARLRYTIDDEGFIQGHMGGGVVIDELLDGVRQGAGVESMIPLFRSVMDAAADLDPDADGKCRQVSATLEFKAAPAFVRR
jgi:hypothetical protein